MYMFDPNHELHATHITTSWLYDHKYDSAS